MPALHEDKEALLMVLSSRIQIQLDCTSKSAKGQHLLHAKTGFHASSPPSISAVDYLDRVMKYSFCSNVCFVMAFQYLERIGTFYDELQLSPSNVHRLIITSVMLAAKFFDDIYYNNAYYAKVGGIPLHEINALEKEFLGRVHFQLFLTTDEYGRFETKLINEALNSNFAQTEHVRGILRQKGYRIQKLVEPLDRDNGRMQRIPRLPAVDHVSTGLRSAAMSIPGAFTSEHLDHSFSAMMSLSYEHDQDGPLFV
eukprot:CAMPEP_0182447514 /NCGR_PEP_ID=MMETSP1172-20130603/16881_1 /TAXON_ID=708627 /ORGANISM="Timspurckia oligopyrenoides, Strain CCMP3278" /LENGTH=253 /DNA_ID=CAMNT_0024643977 /DNA_START=290 /DNA_END=1051 /DNA_ORIENTATION=+